MSSPKLALQTFTVRKTISKSKTLLQTLQQVKSLGFDHLELARIPFTDHYVDKVSSLCNELKISVQSTQMTLKEIARDPERTVAIHNTLNCKNCVVSVVSIKALTQGDIAIAEYAEQLNQLGMTLKSRGVNLLFHHHNFEFVKQGNQTGFDILKRHLDPRYVGFVFDTYWLQRSGFTPAEFIKSHAGWVKGVHLRDLQIAGPFWMPRIKDAALGEGNLDFHSIIEACKQSEVEYVAIEQDTKTPMHSLRTSVAHLKNLGF